MGRKNISCRLSGEQAQCLCEKLIMAVGDCYHNCCITSEDIARKLKVHRNLISHTSNNYLYMPFRDFLNSCRVAEVLRKTVHANKRIQKSIHVIIEECGFCSESTYFRSKKRYFMHFRRLSEKPM